MATAPRAFTRFFSADKTLPSRAMNRMGTQLARMVLARMMHNLRPARVDPSVAEHVATLERDGMLMIPDFLPLPAFEALRRSTEELCAREQAKVKVVKHGPNTLNVISGETVPLVDELSSFYGDPRLPAIFDAVEHRPNIFASHAHRAIERLQQAGSAEQVDPETVLHSDTFFTTHKGWLYLTDVTLDDGPFVFVKRSHLLSRKLLSYAYRESCQQNHGSRRITPQELEDLHLEETVVTCPRNTFVMANTFGFHRRLRGKPGHERLGLHVSLRANPFFARR